MEKKAVITQNSRTNLALQKGEGGFALAPKTYSEVADFARAMCKAGTAIPKHLRDNVGACMAVAMQAFEWGMSPFAVANKSYSVNDRIAYEAQLIAAVVNTRSGLQGRLKYKFEGDGPNLRCTVTGILDGEPVEYRSPLFKDITPKNSPLWKFDPEQQLSYYSARAWARRHVPEVILGVYDRDEFETVDNDITPPSPSVENEEHNEPEDAQIIDMTPPSPGDVEDDASFSKYGAFDSLGEYLEGLQIALAGCENADEVESLWSEFDPMATLEGDDHSQTLAINMKERALDKLIDKPNEDSGGLFQD